MHHSNHTSSSDTVVEKRISGLGLVFLLGFMLLSAWGVIRGLNAESGSELFGHAYAITAEQAPQKMS